MGLTGKLEDISYLIDAEGTLSVRAVARWMKCKTKSKREMRGTT
jgi:hypothetical protein